MRLPFILASMLLAFTASAQTPAAQQGSQAAPRGNAENGKRIYTTYGCYQCHTYGAHGSGAGPRLAPRPIPYPAFTRAIREPRDEMPPYTQKVVTDQELADIYAFLLTIPIPPAVNTIPQLRN